jgi:hypothetical protein
MLGVSVLALLAGGGCEVRSPARVAHDTLTGAAAALRAAGSATVRFHVVLYSTVGRDRVTWRGTTLARYGDKPASATEFTEFAVKTSGTRNVKLRTITVGDVRYHDTDELVRPEGKSWVRLESGNSVSYGTRVADPDLGLIDPLAYLGVLESVSIGTASIARTDETETIDGAEARAYRVVCSLGSDGCPESDLGNARRIFSGDNQISIRFWLDDQGRTRRVVGGADLDAGTSQVGTRMIYRLQVNIDVVDLGKPVESAEPPSSEVTTEVRIARPTGATRARSRPAGRCVTRCRG